MRSVPVFHSSQKTLSQVSLRGATLKCLCSQPKSLSDRDKSEVGWMAIGTSWLWTSGCNELSLSTNGSLALTHPQQCYQNTTLAHHETLWETTLQNAYPNSFCCPVLYPASPVHQVPCTCVPHSHCSQLKVLLGGDAAVQAVLSESSQVMLSPLLDLGSLGGMC